MVRISVDAIVGQREIGYRRADALRLISPRILVPRLPAHVGRTLHHDKAGPFQMLDKALADDLRHDLIGVVDALATLEAQRVGQRVGEVGQIREGKLISVHQGRIAERSERNKNMLRGLRVPYRSRRP
jgi:hypothetical protein